MPEDKKPKKPEQEPRPNPRVQAFKESGNRELKHGDPQRPTPPQKPGKPSGR